MFSYNNINIVETEARKALKKLVKPSTRQAVVELKDGLVAAFLEGVVSIQEAGNTLFTFNWYEDYEG